MMSDRRAYLWASPRSVSSPIPPFHQYLFEEFIIEVYINVPPGISNKAELRFAISVAQFVLNLSTFSGLLEDMHAFHGQYYESFLSKR